MARKTIQFFLRVSPELADQFRARCEDSGEKHTDVARMLLSEYAAGRLNLQVQATTTPVQQKSIEDYLK